jgi:hypothetical protein
MRPPRVGAASAVTETTPVTHQGTSCQRSPRRLHCSPNVTPSHGLRTNTRHTRWQHHRRIDGWDIAVYVAFTLFCVAIIGVVCVTLYLVAP